MFFKLAFRNGRRSRKENGLFFSTLLITVIAFYIILSLPNQDVMIFLQQMESDAVKRLISMLPLFFGAALVILFFLSIMRENIRCRDADMSSGCI